MNNPLNCSLLNCNRKYKIKGFCKKHYQQFLRNGKTCSKTKFDKNDIIKNNNYAEIIIYDYNKIGEEPTEKVRVKIDLEDINIIKDKKWRLSGNYISSGANSVYLHRIILKTKDGEEIDHINHDTLDNRKQNLRKVTKSQNLMNKKIKGYYFHKKYGKWISKIIKNGVCYYLGTFNNENDALRARKKAEKKYFGEYRYFGKKAEVEEVEEK